MGRATRETPAANLQAEREWYEFKMRGSNAVEARAHAVETYVISTARTAAYLIQEREDFNV